MGWTVVIKERTNIMNFWEGLGIGICVGAFIVFMYIMSSSRYVMKTGAMTESGKVIVVDCNNRYYRLEQESYSYSIHGQNKEIHIDEDGIHITKPHRR